LSEACRPLSLRSSADGSTTSAATATIPQMAPAPATILRRNPFAGLAAGERESSEQTFVELFELAAGTLDEREEAWAYERMRELHLAAITDDRGPSLYEAMSWALSQASCAPA
jgi:hypothetical protein